MLMFQPKSKKINNWVVLPIVAKYANSKGFTDFKDGLSPDYFVEDNLFPAVQLGEEEEPLLAKAIEIIAGNTISLTKKFPFGFEKNRSTFSTFEKIKQNDFMSPPRYILNACEFE